jgi:hypothetical protein
MLSFTPAANEGNMPNRPAGADFSRKSAMSPPLSVSNFAIRPHSLRTNFLWFALQLAAGQVRHHRCCLVRRVKINNVPHKTATTPPTLDHQTLLTPE